MASSQAPVATFMDKLLTIPVLAKVLYAALSRLILSPLSPGPKPSTLFKDVAFTAIRVNLTEQSAAQEQWLNPTTEQVYLDVTKKVTMKPDISVLDSGLKMAWIGPKSAEKVIYYIHGGGFVLAGSAGHVQWLCELQKDLSKKQEVAVVMLIYTLAPKAQYPTQLKQAAEGLNWLVKSQGKKPSNMIIAGDSAGGNLTLALLSHVLHPHPDLADDLRVSLPEPLAGAVLISPWVNFVPDQDDSLRRNQATDIVTATAARRWSSFYLGDSKLDNYNQAANADFEWFQGLDATVKDVLIWGGGGEVLIDSIQVFERKLKRAHRRVDYVEQPGAAHEDFIMEKLLGYTHKAEGTVVIENWIASRL